MNGEQLLSVHYLYYYLGLLKIKAIFVTDYNQ